MAFLFPLRRLCRNLALLATAFAAPAAAAPAPAPAPLAAKIDAYLEPLLRTNNFSGVVLIAKGDEIVFKKGYGFANIEQQAPNRPGTVFHVASVSKPFTAAAILLLAERGRIDLHAPLTALLPDYPNGGRLTVHHLLTHTSGIPNINDFPEYDEVQYKPHSPEQLVAWFKDRPLEFEPGEKFAYSNSNYNLLALIIEKASGKTYGDFLKQEIFDRLGLAATGHPQSAARIVPGLADGYAPEGSVGLQRARYLDWSVKTGNGSLYSTALDLVRFIHGLHSGRLLSPRSLAASFTQHTPNVGYGWFLTTANGREIHHINGRSPGWAAQVDHYVKDDVTVAVLSNIYASVTTPMARAIGAIHFGMPHEPMPELSAEQLPAAAAARLVGSYRFGPDYYVPDAVLKVVVRHGDLEALYSNGYPPMPLVPTGPTRFIIRPFWAKAEFVVGADGRASEFVIDGFRGARVAEAERR